MESGSSALGFLKEMGFLVKSSDNHHFDAVSPGGDMVFYVEYELKGSVKYSEFRMVRLYRGTPLEVDSGTIQWAVSAAPDGSILFGAKGKEINDWEFTALPKIIEKIPEHDSFCAGDASAARTADEEVNGHGNRLPAHAEGNLPSTAEAMIALELERRREMAEDPETRKKVRWSLSGSLESPEWEDKLDIWPYNQLVLDYMNENYGGDQRILSISLAFHAILNNDKTKISYLANLFGICPQTIALLLAVRNLHPKLCGLLDKPKRDPERISPEALDLLVRIPIDEQVRIWEEAQEAGKKRNPLIVLRLKEFGAKYLDQFNEKHLWSMRSEIIARP
jgi:hypothetical protein